MSSALSLSRRKCPSPSFLRVVTCSRFLLSNNNNHIRQLCARRNLNTHAKIPQHSSLHTQHVCTSPQQMECTNVTERIRSSKVSHNYTANSLRPLSRAEAFQFLKKNSRGMSSVSSVQLRSLLDAITGADLACANLQHSEITRLFQWLHYSNPNCLDTEQAAIVEQYLTLLQRSMRELPLPTTSTSILNFSHTEAQERDLFINTVYGLQNLIGVDQKNKDTVFTSHLVNTLGTLFQRKKNIEQVKVARTRSNTNAPSLTSPFSPHSILLSRNTAEFMSPSPQHLNSSSTGLDSTHSMRPAASTGPRRVRNKIVFASSPKTSFSEYILNCFSQRQAADQRQNNYSHRSSHNHNNSHSHSHSHSHRFGSRSGRGGRYYPSPSRDGGKEASVIASCHSSPVSVSGNDIKLVLNGLSLLDSEQEEVRDLLKMVAEEWFPQCHVDLTAQQVSLCFAGMHRMCTSYYEVRQVVRVLTSAVMNCFECFSAVDMSRLISGVQCCDASHPELQQRLLTVVLTKLRYNSSLASGKEVLSVPLFCRALSGLRNINSENTEGIRLLKRLHRYLRVNSGRGGGSSGEAVLLGFTPFQVSKCLDGIRQVGVADKTTKKILQTLASGVIYSSDDDWTTTVVCDLLSQMGSLSLSRSEGEGEMCDMLAAVTNKLRVALKQTGMTGRDLGQAMTCLQHLRSDTSSAQGLLTVLTESLTEMRRQQLAGGGEQAGGEGLQQWNRGKSYGDVLFGLKNMSGERDEVERFLFAFSDYLNVISKPLLTEEVALLFVQLRHVRTETPALRQLVTVLTALLNNCESGGFTSRQIGLCMFGLSELSNEQEEVRCLLGVLHSRVLFRSVQMNADDLSLALYGLKSCSYHHPKMNRILSVLRHKAHMIFAKPTQPWADYERMLSTSHAGMLPDVLQQDTSSNPAFSMHSLATALEGVRRLNQSLCREDHHGDEQAQKTLERVQDLQATLLTKLKYTDAPLNLTHLSLFLNAIRFNPTEFYHDPSEIYESNVMKMLAYKCVTKLYVTPAENYQQQIGFVLYHLRRCKVTHPWNKVILLNSVFPQLEQATVPLDYVNMMYVLHLLVHSKVDNNNGHMRNSTNDTLVHLAAHLRWALEFKKQSNTADLKWNWSADMAKEMTDLIKKIRRSRPHAVLEDVVTLIGEMSATSSTVPPSMRRDDD